MAIRRTTAKSAATRVRRRAAGKAPADTVGSAAVIVTEEQSRRLIEDVANFHAARYRPIEPGQYRDEDRCAAEKEIKTVLKRCRKSK